MQEKSLKIAYLCRNMEQDMNYKAVQHIIFVTKVQLVGILYNKYNSNTQNVYNIKTDFLRWM
jgi:hypothetical protein